MNTCIRILNRRPLILHGGISRMDSSIFALFYPYPFSKTPVTYPQKSQELLEPVFSLPQNVQDVQDACQINERRLAPSNTKKKKKKKLHSTVQIFLVYALVNLPLNHQIEGGLTRKCT